MKPNIVVYTAISREYDQLQAVPEAWKKEASFVAFLDSPTGSNDWEVRPLHRGFSDPCRNAKIHKILAHRYFPEAEFTLWIDGCVQIKAASSLTTLVSSALQQHDIALFRHRRRACIYAEAEACKAARKDSAEIIDRQIATYLGEGYPPNNGLAECTVILRRNTDTIARFNERWHEEIAKFSRRDQLSFDYVAHRLGVTYSRIPGTIARNDYFHRLKHEQPAATSIAAVPSVA